MKKQNNTITNTIAMLTCAAALIATVNSTGAIGQQPGITGAARAAVKPTYTTAKVYNAGATTPAVLLTPAFAVNSVALGEAAVLVAAVTFATCGQQN